MSILMAHSRTSLTWASKIQHLYYLGSKMEPKLLKVWARVIIIHASARRKIVFALDVSSKSNGMSILASLDNFLSIEIL